MNFKRAIIHFLYDHCLPLMINRRWKHVYGHKIDWKNPRDINEKMQWLVCFSDTSLWTRCADKLLVRDFVKERGLSDLLIEIYGVWKNADDIDFDSLPEKCILKCNHDSASYVIVDKKVPFNKDEVRASLNKALKVQYGYINGEVYYNKIQPCIIAEKFLESKECSFSSSLVDYKVWSFDGKPYCTWACYNRTKHSTYVNIYDMDWSVRPECSVITDHYLDGKGLVPKPKTFDKMMDAAAILSKGFPEVRVDFYEVDGVLYFGEMTFMSIAGQIDCYTDDFLVELGNQCVLPTSHR